uniref:Aladin seven-bladed propeller domain-containing protein n=1 Tax=Onchocerca volvulus TaxID=6282 RepID=A0A8R1Y3N9_ONCVO
MSPYGFPPIESSVDLPVCLYETNGRLIYGAEKELHEMEANVLLGTLPKIEKELLDRLQQSVSHDNIRETFVDNQQSRFQQAVNSWTTKGIGSLVDYVRNAVSETVPYSGWLSSASQVFSKAQADITNIFAKSEESLYNSIVQTSSTLNWSTNWVRCIAVHNGGHRIAVCQNNDCIRIFCCGSDRSPITLKHERQQNVTDMAWKPFDRMVLAVACSHAVLIWRLDKQNLNIRPSVNCADVIEMSSFAPIIQCFWDSVFDQALFVVSASLSCLQVLDTSNGESELVGSWAGGRIRHVWISPNGDKIAVAYARNIISVYDRHLWREERWKKLKGVCMAAAWTPLSDVFFFATRNETCIRALHFVKKLQNMESDQLSYGSEIAVPVYDLSEMILEYLDSSRAGNSSRNTCNVDEYIRDMKISPDGQRIAIAFSANPTIIALFVIETMPSFFLAPCGLINGAANFGLATILSFFPKFQYGSLLIIVWSAGKVQYIPLLYGYLASEGVHLNRTKNEKLIDELSSEHLLIRDSQLCGRISSRSNAQIQKTRLSNNCSHSEENANENSTAASSVNVELFSSTGLYDLLALKNAEKAN